MAAVTYTEIVADAPTWMIADNNDVADNLDRIIKRAHNRLLNLLDHDLFETTLSGLTIGTDGILDLSTQDPPVLEVRSLQVPHRSAGRVPLIQRNEEYLRAAYPIPQQGTPRYYGREGAMLVYKVWPQPYAPITPTVIANVEPLVLSASNESNAMSTRAPRALMQAVYYEIAYFMKEWDAVEAYRAELLTALNEANTSVTRRRRDESETRPKDTANRIGQ